MKRILLLFVVCFFTLQSDIYAGNNSVKEISHVISTNKTLVHSGWASIQEFTNDRSIPDNLYVKIYKTKEFGLECYRADIQMQKNGSLIQVESNVKVTLLKEYTGTYYRFYYRGYEYQA